MIRKCKVFVPAHITGFFEIVSDSNPLLMGSKGAGITLDKGVVTSTVVEEGDGELIVTINGKENLLNTISHRAVSIICERYGIDLSKFNVYIDHETSLPISAGYGTSAGFALGISFSLAQLLGINISFNEAGEIAHLTEVYESCGLGDVISEMYGGCVIRIKEGSPVRARIDKVRISQPIYVITKALSSIKTSDIIENPTYKKRINSSGHKLLNELLNKSSIENFIKLSRKFSEDTKLISPELREILNILDDETIGSSMAILGNTAFALSYTPDTSIEDAVVTKINTTGIQYKKID